ncbi:MAG TPA: plastocyanin/azurin family copper-binding protein [Mycobacteriales bacterium]
MRPAARVVRAAGSLAGAAALLAYAFAGTSAAEDQTVQATGGNVFTPAAVTIDPGDTVTWQYAGGFGHTVTSTSGGWSKDTSLGPPAATFQTSYLFDQPGTYTYVCKTHESVGMKGTVTVRGTVQPTKKPTPTRTSTRPQPTRTTSAPATSRPPSTSPTASPSPSTGSASPVLPSGSVSPVLTTPPPQPTVAPEPSGTPFLGEGGLIPPPPSGRAKGFPVMLALLLIGGVGSAEVRALLANAPD